LGGYCWYYWGIMRTNESNGPSILRAHTQAVHIFNISTSQVIKPSSPKWPLAHSSREDLIFHASSHLSRNSRYPCLQFSGANCSSSLKQRAKRSGTCCTTPGVSLFPHCFSTAEMDAYCVNTLVSNRSALISAVMTKK